MNSMLVVPAIDILDGKVVRLTQGEFSRVDVFSENPLELGQRLVDGGITRLHLVDLSGARDPQARQSTVISNLVRATRLSVQVGGGVRTAEDALALVDMGVDRVVVGSLPFLAREEFLRLGSRIGWSRVTVALDVREGPDGNFTVMIRGWQEASQNTIEDAMRGLLVDGARRFLCTDIARDGAMLGPAFEFYDQLKKQFPLAELQASGGVRSYEDLLRLKKDGAVHSAIVGRAWLSRKISLAEMRDHVES